jgi:Lipocalin-like domain
VEELQSRWGQFAANAGTYEVSGDTVTQHVVVAKNPELQGKTVTRATIKLEGNNLWVTPVEGARGKVENPPTFKYVRVE